MSHYPYPIRYSLSLIAGAAFAGVVFLSDARANLVADGGFEAGVTFVAGGSGVAAGGGVADWYEGNLALNWQLGGSQITNALATNSQAYFDVGGGPKSGVLAAVLANTPIYDGYISQAILGVVAGQAYRVSFWLSNQIGDNPFNYIDVNWGGTYTGPNDPISGGVSLAGGGPAIPGAIPVQPGWTYYEFDVVAPSNNARLSFIGGNTAAGTLIDDVIVVVPEVSSFGVAMGLGLLAFGSTVRLRRRALLSA